MTENIRSIHCKEQQVMLGKWQSYLGSAWLPFILSGMDEYTKLYRGV